MVAWNMGGQRFAFGNLAPHQTQLYEDNPELAWQQLMDFYAKGNPNFAATTLGRFIVAQMDQVRNRETIAQGEQVARNTANKIQWQNQEDKRKSAWQAEYNRLNQRWQDMETSYGSGNHPDVLRAKDEFDAFKKAGFTPGTFTPEPTLTLTKFMEQDPNINNYVEQFNQLSASQRGANPGIFKVRREIW